MTNYNTYARAVISDNPVITDFIKKYAGHAAEASKAGKAQFDILDDDQIENAFKDPHSKYLIKFIVNLPQFLVLQAKIDRMLNEVLRQRTLLEKASLNLDRKAVTDPDVDEANKAMIKLDELDLEYRKLLDMHIDTLKQREELKAAFKSLDELMRKQDGEWDNFRKEKLTALIADLEAQNVELIEEEKQQILADESWADLLERVQDAKLELPKRIDINKPSVETYNQLKDYLAKHASLGRRMLPNSMADIEKIKTKKQVKEIAKSAKALTKAQEKEGADVGKPLGRVKSRLDTLTDRLIKQRTTNENFLTGAFSDTQKKDIKKEANFAEEYRIVSKND